MTEIFELDTQRGASELVELLGMIRDSDGVLMSGHKEVLGVVVAQEAARHGRIQVRYADEGKHVLYTVPEGPVLASIVGPNGGRMLVQVEKSYVRSLKTRIYEEIQRRLPAEPFNSYAERFSLTPVIQGEKGASLKALCLTQTPAQLDSLAKKGALFIFLVGSAEPVLSVMADACNGAKLHVNTKEWGDIWVQRDFLLVLDVNKVTAAIKKAAISSIEEFVKQEDHWVPCQLKQLHCENGEGIVYAMNYIQYRKGEVLALQKTALLTGEHVLDEFLVVGKTQKHMGLFALDTEMHARLGFVIA